jgi:hypothetical protein
VIEPDSLANLATNANVKKCAESDGIYRRIDRLCDLGALRCRTSLYLDAGHARAGSATRTARSRRDLQGRARPGRGAQKIRGFATNISGYCVLRGDDGRRLDPSNPCSDELSYVELSGDLAKVGITGKAFVIDTSRNAPAAGSARRRANGAASRAPGSASPRAAPAPLVDAYWDQGARQSDGTSDARPRFDKACAAERAKNAPEAGVLPGLLRRARRARESAPHGSRQERNPARGRVAVKKRSVATYSTSLGFASLRAPLRRLLVEAEAATRYGAGSSLRRGASR